MGLIPVMMFAGLTLSALALTNTTDESSTSPPLPDASSPSPNVTHRRGKQLQVDRIELPFPGTEIKRQVIRIPPNVSKVKVINTIPVGSGRRKRVGYTRPQAFASSRYATSADYDYGFVQDDDDDVVDDFSAASSSSIKRNFNSNARGGEATFDESLQADETFGRYAGKDSGKYVKKYRPGKWKLKRKVPKQAIESSNAYEYYEKSPERFVYKGDGDFSGLAGNSYRHEYYDSEPVESSLYVRQTQPAVATYYAVKNGPVTQQDHQAGKSVWDKQQMFLGKYPFEPNYIPAAYYGKKTTAAAAAATAGATKSRKKLPVPQYTTHNPQVATNFGLSGFTTPNSYFYKPTKVHYAGDAATSLGYPVTTSVNGQSTSATEQLVNSISVYTPGIKVIKPPQFGETIAQSNSITPSRLVSPPSLPQQQQQQQSQSQHHVTTYDSQKATIRDILEQDCPNHEVIGFCESPPRYPMHQIGIIVKKCARFMEVMNTQNLVDQHDFIGFSSRSDVDVSNYTMSASDADIGHQDVAQRRSSNEGVPACQSDFTLIEPGYAKEVTSGKWLVVVQHPETSQQRITTDTCKSPGSPCAGFGDVKCSRPGSGSGSRSTKCVQRFSYHRLISWDPDVPDACPRMRIFKFPSACVCHVGVTP